jgi:cytochrome b6-f complex iron-sulfur subunit
MTDSGRFDEAIERLLDDKSPKDIAGSLDEDERRMLQMAQLLKGSDPTPQPAAELPSSLIERLPPPQSRPVSRRAVLTGLGALAAGVIAGVALDKGVTEQTAAQPYPDDNVPLVGQNGSWTHIMSADALPEGAVKSFKSGAITGFVMRRNGKITALSGVCTHMGCLLEYKADTNGLVCPCHGATFDAEGKLRSYPNHYNAKLPDLPWLQVRRRGNSIEVFTI